MLRDVATLRQPALLQVGQHAAHDPPDLLGVDLLGAHRTAADRFVGKAFFGQQATIETPFNLSSVRIYTCWNGS